MWRQVLLLAIKDSRGQSVGVKPHDKRSAQQRAHAWIFSASEHPGSFKWCCEVLDVDPQAVHRQILPTDWEPGGDELTPTMKLKRRPIAEKYSEEIEALYS